MANESKDKLVGMSVGQKDPYQAKGEDFPAGKAGGAFGQSADASGQKNQLVPWGGNLTSPRLVETGGDTQDSGTPVPGDRGAQVARNFPVKTNDGESGSSPSSVGFSGSIDLASGDIECKGASQTRVKEVPESSVSIG